MWKSIEKTGVEANISLRGVTNGQHPVIERRGQLHQVNPTNIGLPYDLAVVRVENGDGLSLRGVHPKPLDLS